MTNTLIIADDYTGAIDTGVKFAKKGIETKVVIGDVLTDEMTANGEEVIVINTETRHLPKEEAYRILYKVVRNAVNQGFRHIYKKTDSALRGNIGSELTAASDAAGKNLYFVPAFPEMKRIVKNGVLFIDGEPVENSDFGRDPFDPVPCSDVADIIHMQSDIPVLKTSVNDYSVLSQSEPDRGIVCFDAETEQDLFDIGKWLCNHQRLSLIAGCAGFAEHLPELFSLTGKERKIPAVQKPLLVLSGSIHPTTLAQICFAERNGFIRYCLSNEEKLAEGHWDTVDGEDRLNEIREHLKRGSSVILDSSNVISEEDAAAFSGVTDICPDMLREQIAASFGKILEKLIGELNFTIVVIGGDTLLGCLKAIGVSEVWPYEEILPGVVLSGIRSRSGKKNLISKSGGFGEESFLTDVVQILK